MLKALEASAALRRKDDGLIAYVDSLPQGERDAYAAKGGISALDDQPHGDESNSFGIVRDMALNAYDERKRAAAIGEPQDDAQVVTLYRATQNAQAYQNAAQAGARVVSQAGGSAESPCSALMDVWVRYQKAQNPSWNGRTADRAKHLREFIAHMGADRDWHAVEKKHAQAWRNALATESPYQQRDKLTHVKAMFSAAIKLDESGADLKNPFAGVTAHADIPDPEAKPYTPEQMTALRNAARAHPVWAVKWRGAGLMGFEVTAYTAMRTSETGDLCKRDVVREHGRVVVYPSRHKTPDAKRFMVLPKAFGETFYKWAQASKTEELFAHITPDKSKKTRSHWWSENFPAIRTAAGTPTDRSMYELRDTMCSRLEVCPLASPRMGDFLTGHAAKGVKARTYIKFEVLDVACAIDAIKVFADD